MFDLFCYIQVKSEQYWPENDVPVTYGNLTITMVTEKVDGDWSVRDFTIQSVSRCDFCFLVYYYKMNIDILFHLSKCITKYKVNITKAVIHK